MGVARSKRGRRALPQWTPNAPFVPWTGPNFLQQTNFTGFTAGNNTVTDAAGTAELTPEWSVAELAWATGDICLVQGTITVQATFPVVQTHFVVKLHTDDNDQTIADVQIDSGSFNIIQFQIILPVKAGPAWAVGAQQTVVDADAPAEIRVTEIATQEDSTPGTMQITVDIDQASSEVTLYATSITRIRQGIT